MKSDVVCHPNLGSKLIFISNCLKLKMFLSLGLQIMRIAVDIEQFSFSCLYRFTANYLTPSFGPHHNRVVSVQWGLFPNLLMCFSF